MTFLLGSDVLAESFSPKRQLLLEGRDVSNSLLFPQVPRAGVRAGRHTAVIPSLPASVSVSAQVRLQDGLYTSTESQGRPVE